MEKSQQECTHNCMTCGAGCSEQGGDGVGKLEKTLNALADIDKRNESGIEKGRMQMDHLCSPFTFLGVDYKYINVIMYLCIKYTIIEKAVSYGNHHQ